MDPEKLKTAIKTADAPALEALVDSLFAGLEARTTNPIILGLLKGANTILDLVLSKYGL